MACKHLERARDVLFYLIIILGTLGFASSCESTTWDLIEKNKNNKTALGTMEAAAWVSPSEFRDTKSILQSCIVTLVACVYTALHLNLPSHSQWWYLALRKAYWMLLAIFAPEVVIVMAASQFVMAWKLRTELRELRSRHVTAANNEVCEVI